MVSLWALLVGSGLPLSQAKVGCRRPQKATLPRWLCAQRGCPLYELLDQQFSTCGWKPLGWVQQPFHRGAYQYLHYDS